MIRFDCDYYCDQYSLARSLLIFPEQIASRRMDRQNSQPQLRTELNDLATELLCLICNYAEDRDLLAFSRLSRRFHHVALRVYLERHGMPDPSTMLFLDTHKLEVFHALRTALFVTRTEYLHCSIRSGRMDLERTILAFASFIGGLDRVGLVSLNFWGVYPSLQGDVSHGTTMMRREAWNRLTGSLLNALSDKISNLIMAQLGDRVHEAPPYDFSEELGMGTNSDAAAKHMSQLANSGSDVVPTPVEMAPTHAVKLAFHRRLLSLTESAKRALVHLPRAFNRSHKEQKAVDSVQPPSERPQSPTRWDKQHHRLTGAPSIRSEQPPSFDSETAPFHLRPLTSLCSFHVQSRYLLYHPFLTWTIDTINSSALDSLTLLWHVASNEDWGIFLSQLTVPSLSLLRVSLGQLRLKDVANFLSRHQVRFLELVGTTFITDSDNTLAYELLQPALARMRRLKGPVSSSISVLLQDVQAMPCLTSIILNLASDGFARADEILRRLPLVHGDKGLGICLTFATGHDFTRYVTEGLTPGTQRVECLLHNVGYFQLDCPNGHRVLKENIHEFILSICNWLALFPSLVGLTLWNPGLSAAGAGAGATLVRAIHQTNSGLVTVCINGVNRSVREWILDCPS
jgi:hypothetical protein